MNKARVNGKAANRSIVWHRKQYEVAKWDKMVNVDISTIARLPEAMKAGYCTMLRLRVIILLKK